MSDDNAHLIRKGELSSEVIMGMADEIKSGLADVRIILFGSYAYGRPNHNSDVDIAVIYPDGLEALTGEPIDLRARHLVSRKDIHKDIVAIRQSRFEKLKTMPGSLSYTLALRGIEL